MSFLNIKIFTIISLILGLCHEINPKQNFRNLVTWEILGEVFGGKEICVSSTYCDIQIFLELPGDNIQL
jgi:hypothetical protein